MAGYDGMRVAEDATRYAKCKIPRLYEAMGAVDKRSGMYHALKSLKAQGAHHFSNVRVLGKQVNQMANLANWEEIVIGARKPGAGLVQEKYRFWTFFRREKKQ